MAHKTKRDRLAAIKAATNYPSTREALDTVRRARDLQSIKRPIDPESVPTSIESPKHLSGLYRRAIKRYVSRISEQCDLYREEIYRALKMATKVPQLARRLNPAYYVVIPSSHNYRAIGPIMPDYESSTVSRVTGQKITITPKLTAKAQNILRAIPSDTPAPEARAQRDWATWILTMETRIEEGAKLDAEIAATRQAQQRAGVKIVAESIRDAHDQALITRLVSATPRHTVITNHPDGYGKLTVEVPASIPAIPYTPNSPTTALTPFQIGTNQLFRNRQPLSTLVPLARA